jgi:type I restriction enzyme S subunit
MSVKPHYKLTEIGAIPEEWRAQVFTHAVQVNPSRSLVVGREYPFVPMDALTTDSPRTRYVLSRVWNQSSGSRFQNGDVLLARITPSAENGKTALVDSLKGDGTGFGSTEFLVLSPKTGGIEDSRFLYHLIKFEKIRNQAIQRMTGSTGRQRIPPEAFNDILCPVPPVSEQQRIASILSTVDDAIQKTDEIIETTQQLKKGLMQQLLTRGIGHTKFKQTEIGKIPEEWGVVPIEKLGNVITGTTPSTTVKEYYGSKYVFVSPADIGASKFVMKTTKSLSDKGLKVSRPIPPGSIFVTCISSYDGIGKIGMSTTTSTTNQQINSVVCHEKVNPDFLYYSLDYHRSRIQTYAVRSGGHFAIITKQLFSSIPMPKPSESEQSRIACILSSVDNKLEHEKNTRTGLERLKKGLMQVLLTGKVRVKVR